MAGKKLPSLGDVRDESAEDLRIVLEPKSRNVDPDVLKESLFRLTDLESRFALNLNVLDATRTPKVMGLKQLLTEWLQHQIIVLVRRAQHRINKIDDRLELVETGRASCRERVCRYVYISVVAVSLEKKKHH